MVYHHVCVSGVSDMQPLELEVGLGRVSDSSLCVGTATASNIKDLATQNSMEA